MRTQNVSILVTTIQIVSAEVKQIQSETDSKVVELTPLLDGDIDSYIEMMDYNVDELIVCIESEDRNESNLTFNTILIISSILGASLLGLIIFVKYR